MDYLIVCSVALLASGLTLFSGFGLGTLMLPTFLLFFPPQVAVALTAIVHLLNNLMKAGLLGRYADRSVVLRFGLPALAAAYFGARALLWLEDLNPWMAYSLRGQEFEIMPLKAVIGGLMIIFAVVELSPMKKWAVAPSYQPLGGLLSGFFGGLSGHQGALRSMFLLRSGLGKEAFIGSGVLIACLIDLSRLFVYSGRFAADDIRANMGLLAAATAAAFLGAFVGNRLMHKVTLRTVQRLVATMLFVLAVALILGLI